VEKTMSIVRINPYLFPAERASVTGGWTPAADVWETADAYRIDLDVPSLSANEVEVSVEEGVLIMSGERRRAERQEGERNHRLERRSGQFSRRFKLPENADPDAISARVHCGVLEVTIAKREEHKPRRVEVIAA
jgi:HSP20 family protein